MSDKVVLDAILMLLFEKQILSEEDLRRITSAKGLAESLVAQGILSREVVDQYSQELANVVSTITELHKSGNLDKAAVQKVRQAYPAVLEPFFGFVERSLT